MMILFGERSNGPTFLQQKNQLGCLETTGNTPRALPSFPGKTTGVLRGTPRWWTLSQHPISQQHSHTLVRLPKQRPYGKKTKKKHAAITRTHIFVPVAVEILGPINVNDLNFLNKLATGSLPSPKNHASRPFYFKGYLFLCSVST